MTDAPHSYIPPWTEELDLDHPGIDDEPSPRYVLERHTHMLQHDRLDTFQYIAATAAYIESAGPHIELGLWSMSETDARVLAASLIALADTIADLEHQNAARYNPEV